MLKIALFVLYLAVVSRSEDMHRMFQFHGAEHKTIACYEAGEELTPENVKKYTRFHPRCGTSFLLIVLVVSMLVFSFITWDSLAVRVLLKLILLPVTVGISFEIIRYAGRYSNPLTRLISAPGLVAAAAHHCRTGYRAHRGSHCRHAALYPRRRQRPVGELI